MHPKTESLAKAIRSKESLMDKTNLLKGSYEGETCYLLTCGPSMNAFWNEEVRQFLSDKLVVSVKQTYDIAPEIVDFHLLNSWNYTPYEYAVPKPIVIAERADDDPETPGLDADLMFRVGDPRNFEKRLATSFHFDLWKFDATLERPWGPGIVYELGIYLMEHIGVREIVAMGWDLGELNSPRMEHFFKEAPPESAEDDGICNKPRIRNFEVRDIARSTRPLYYWLRSKGIYLYIVSDRSLVDSVVPRTGVFDERIPWHYETFLLDEGSFDNWNGSGQNVWVPVPSPEAARLLEPSEEGEAVVEILPGSKKRLSGIFFLHQTEEYFKGGTIDAQIDAFCSEPGKFAFVVGLMKSKNDSTPLLCIKEHLGDSQWHTLSVRCQVPPDVDIRFIKINATLRGGAKYPARVANSKARFIK